ncbi:MAG: hypothetical protein ACC656_14640, partial [Candidatus Heimdallarchaeota archaeon]
IPFDKIIAELESYPGLYSWYIRPKPKRENEIIPILYELLQQTELKATLTGNLRLSYEGTLTKKNIDFNAQNNEMLRNIFITVPYPLYVGISLNLKDRLKVHIEQLHNCMSLLHDYKYEEEFSLDSNEESSYFGKRLASIFLKSRVRALDCLYIRIYEYKNKGTSDMLSKAEKKNIKVELAEVEHIANSIFNPVFGRR